MGFGNFVKGIVAQVLPGGGTYGSYNPPKKKRPDQPQINAPGLSVGVAHPNQNINVPQSMPRPQQPANVFDTLNKGLNLNQPNNAVPVLNNNNMTPAPRPQPGTVIKPSLNVTPAPPQPLQIGNTAINRDPTMRTSTPYVAPTKGYQAPEGVSGNRGTQDGQTGTFATNPRNGQTHFVPDVPKAQDNRFWQKMGRGVKTVGQTAVGTVANVPEIGLAALRTGSGIVQGALNLPHDITALTAGTTEQIQKHFNNPVTRQVNRGFQDINTGTKKATHYVVNDTFDPINRNLDSAANLYERHVPGAAGGAKVYRNEQPLLNILAALVTAGGSTAGDVGEGANVAQNAGKFARFKSFIDDILNKPITDNENSVISKTSQSIIDKGRPVVEKLNAPIKTGSDLINKFRPNKAEKVIIDSGELGNIINDTQPTQIPVSTGVTVTGPPSESVSVPVTNTNTPSPLIQEIGGDAKTATTNAQAAQNAINVRRVEAAKRADSGLPDQNIEGVTPRPVEKPFSLNPEVAAEGQSKVVKDYADMLKGMGEGNGVNLVPDGESYGYGYKRVSDNIRFGDTGGKRMTKQDWLDEAERQLKSGKGEPGVQQAFNDAGNPEVQQLISKGEQVPIGEGRPITVKQVNGIPVTDQTNVPTNLPENPGTVRQITSTAPSKAKTEIAAAENATVTTTAKPPETAPGVKTAPATPAENFPAPAETDENFLKRVATDMQSNIKRATDALKTTKKMTKAQRAEQAARGQTAYEEAKAAGKTQVEAERLRKEAMRGSFDRQDYAGTPIHSADEQRLMDMVDEHYKGMSYQAGNVREAFGKLFHSGEPGYHSEAGNHVIPSDIKNIRKFLNESVPNPDGNGGLGDFAAEAIDDLASTEKGPGNIAKAIGLQRALRFTADISATGRQALPGALSHPVEFARAAKKSFEVMFSPEKYEKYASSLRNSKVANYINDELGAHLSVLNEDAGKADDIYRNSNWADKIPGVNKVVAASERQYNTLLTDMRLQAGERFINLAGGIGDLEKAASDSGNPEAFKKAIGTVANVNTGRGLNGDLDGKYAKVLSNVLVSPRGLAARIQRFDFRPGGYYDELRKTNPAAYKEALRSAGIQTAVTISALAAANKAGIYEDGQIKVGNTRYDITGGIANMVRTAVRIAQFMTGHRQTTPFENAPDEATNWAKNQLAPFISSALDTIGIHQDKTGTWVNSFGDDVTAGGEVLHNIAPVNVEQYFSDRKEGTPGTQQGVNVGLNSVGLGVNTYESADDKAAAKVGGKNVYKQLQNSAKQLEKDGISTNDGDIGNYIADGQYDKALRAQEYKLQEIQADPNASPSKIKKAQNSIDETNLRKDGVPIDDDEIQSTIEDGDYDKALEGLNHKLSGLDGASNSKKKPVETDIKRLQVTKDGGYDPSIIKLYDHMSNSDWHKLGDPQDDNYDPGLYQKLWEYDTAMAKAGVSLSDFKPENQKYSAKGAGGKGAGGKTLDTSFGTLGSKFAPSVQQYQSIDQKSGSVPTIHVVRPNIVHKIGSSG